MIIGNAIFYQLVTYINGLEHNHDSNGSIYDKMFNPNGSDSPITSPSPGDDVLDPWGKRRTGLQARELSLHTFLVTPPLHAGESALPGTGTCALVDHARSRKRGRSHGNLTSPRVRYRNRTVMYAARLA